jgi:hypothetical protein
MRPRVLQFIGVVCLALVTSSIAGVFTDGFGSYWNWRDCWVVLFLSVVLMTVAAVGDIWLREDLLLWSKAAHTHRLFWGYFDVPEYLLRGGKLETDN